MRADRPRSRAAHHAGAAILLGLEVLVAADLIRTITSKPSLEDAAILGLIVLIRTILSISIQIEIEGTPPWRRALPRSGGQMIGDAVARDGRRSSRRRPPAGPRLGTRAPADELGDGAHGGATLRPCAVRSAAATRRARVARRRG